MSVSNLLFSQEITEDDYTRINLSDAGGRSVTSGDFNGDAINDIVTVGGGNSCRIFYGNSNFSSMPDYTFGDKEDLNQASSAGDVNGDGYDDLIIQRGYQYNYYNFYPHNLHIYYGSAIGIDTATKAELSYKSIQLSKHSGDINNDGFDDVLIGGENRIYFHYGRSSGINSIPDRVIEYPDAGPLRVTFVGDINDDGFDDFAVPLGNSGTNRKSSVRIYYGSSMGLDTTKSQLLTIDPKIQSHYYYYYPLSVSKAIDVNNDGIDDMIIGDPNGERLFIFYGSSDGLSDIPDKIINKPIPCPGNSRFGEDIEGVGDVNYDGIDDIVVGFDGYNHAFYIFYGSSTGVSESNFTSLTKYWYNYFDISISAVGNFLNDCRNAFVINHDYINSSVLFFPETSITPDFRIEHACDEITHYFYITS